MCYPLSTDGLMVSSTSAISSLKPRFCPRRAFYLRAWRASHGSRHRIELISRLEKYFSVSRVQCRVRGLCTDCPSNPGGDLLDVGGSPAQITTSPFGGCSKLSARVPLALIALASVGAPFVRHDMMGRSVLTKTIVAVLLLGGLAFLFLLAGRTDAGKVCYDARRDRLGLLVKGWSTIRIVSRSSCGVPCTEIRREAGRWMAKSLGFGRPPSVFMHGSLCLKAGIRFRE